MVRSHIFLVCFPERKLCAHAGTGWKGQRRTLQRTLFCRFDGGGSAVDNCPCPALDGKREKARSYGLISVRTCDPSLAPGLLSCCFPGSLSNRIGRIQCHFDIKQVKSECHLNDWKYFLKLKIVWIFYLGSLPLWVMLANCNICEYSSKQNIGVNRAFQVYGWRQKISFHRRYSGVLWSKRNYSQAVDTGRASARISNTDGAFQSY